MDFDIDLLFSTLEDGWIRFWRRIYVFFFINDVRIERVIKTLKRRQRIASRMIREGINGPKGNALGSACVTQFPSSVVKLRGRAAFFWLVTVILCLFCVVFAQRIRESDELAKPVTKAIDIESVEQKDLWNLLEGARALAATKPSKLPDAKSQPVTVDP